MDEALLIVVYNLAEFVNKSAFVLACWRATFVAPIEFILWFLTFFVLKVDAKLWVSLKPWFV